MLRPISISPLHSPYYQIPTHQPIALTMRTTFVHPIVDQNNTPPLNFTEPSSTFNTFVPNSGFPFFLSSSSSPDMRPQSIQYSVAPSGFNLPFAGSVPLTTNLTFLSPIQIQPLTPYVTYSLSPISSTDISSPLTNLSQEAADLRQNIETLRKTKKRLSKQLQKSDKALFQAKELISKEKQRLSKQSEKSDKDNSLYQTLSQIEEELISPLEQETHPSLTSPTPIVPQFRSKKTSSVTTNTLNPTSNLEKNSKKKTPHNTSKKRKSITET